MVKRFVELVVADLEVQEAREYHDKGTKAQKHPYIRLRHLRKGGGKSFPNYEIKDRYVLYRLLKSCDPSLAYDEMMQTLYHVSIEERPPMQDILQGYIDHAETDRIGVWVERRKDYFLTILAVDNTDFTMSHYFNSTLDFIRANYLPDFATNSRTMTMRGKQYPVMQFIKSVGHSKNNIMIEILSCNNKTYIKGKNIVGKNIAGVLLNYDLQFLLMNVFDGFVHTLHAAELGVYLSRLTRTLEYAATLDLSPESGEFSDSNRLMDWWDKSKLEYENAHITKAGIDGLVNSFYNSFID